MLLTNLVAALFLTMSGVSAPTFQDIETAYMEGRLRFPPQQQEEIECYAKVIWYEARGESAKGKKVVANVVQNRTVFGRPFRQSVCEVVYQKSQFSWTNKQKLKNSKFDNIIKKYAEKEEKQVRDTIRIAIKATMWPLEVTSATHFCGANYNCGFKNTKYLGQVGGHNLYKYLR